MAHVIYEDYAIQVIQHREGAGGVLIGPPDSGHGHGIVDYAPGLSIIEQALKYTKSGVFHINWKSATYARRNESIQDKVDQTLISMAVAETGNLIGLCQSGWLFARVATQRPESVTQLTIAATPIDTSLGESVLKKAQSLSIEKYRRVVAMNGGLMPGWLMLLCWKSANPEKHYYDRYICPTEDTARFYAWYDAVQNLAGVWYLEIMEELFLSNTFKDTLDIKCHVNIATGTKDDVVPPEQSYAIIEHGNHSEYSCEADHFGVFNSKEAMDMWQDVFEDMEI